MTEATLEKAVCEKCGADVRENTLFCYNCGFHFADAARQANGAEQSAMSAAMTDETKSALDDLAAKFKFDEPETTDPFALAAAERRRARVAPKRQKEEVWEENEGRSGGAFFFISLMIFLMVAGVVFITVYWK